MSQNPLANMMSFPFQNNTLAHILGTKPPSDADGEILHEIDIQ